MLRPEVNRVSTTLVQILSLPRKHCSVKISGIPPKC